MPSFVVTALEDGTLRQANSESLADADSWTTYVLVTRY